MIQHQPVPTVFALVLTMSSLSPALAGGSRSEARVASDHPVAAACGARVLQDGGNAADAAVATALCSGVVQPAGSGLGGGGFALVACPGDPTAAVYDFREVAPAGAHRDLFLGADGEVRDGASRRGGLAVAVPGESRGLAALQAAHGRWSPRAVARPAIRHAGRGFRVGGHLADALARDPSAEVLAAFQTRAGLAGAGSWVRRPALARTLRRWASTGGESLHTGAEARSLADHVGAAEGLLTSQDLAAYTVAERAPIVISWRDYTIETMPLPSSGGVVLAQVLQVLEDDDLVAWGHNSAPYLHRLAEAFKHAYAEPGAPPRRSGLRRGSHRAPDLARTGR